MTDPTRKQPAMYREPAFEKLVVNDLIQMASDSRYDRNVLLWMQDRYAFQAMNENMDVLIELMRKGQKEDASPEDVKRDRMEVLAKLTSETYLAEKSQGRGADLKTYLDAATTFFEAESVRYGRHLKDVSEEIAKKLAIGEKPDIDRISRTVYASTFKMSGAIDSLERINKDSAEAVSKMMEQGIKRIEMVAVTDVVLNVGRVLFQAIDKIAQNPKMYIQFVDPKNMEMPTFQPWDFQPEHRMNF